MANNAADLFAENVVDAKYEDLDESIKSRARMRLQDCVGVMSAGARGVGIPGTLDMLKRWGGIEEATVCNFGGKLPLQSAAFINSLQLRSFDFEPIDAEGLLARWPAHVTSTTVPTALALADWKHLCGWEFLIALLLGDDMACRLTEASRFNPLGCFDGNGTNNTMGATAIAAKVMGLTAEQTKAAFSIALNMCGGTMAVTQGSWCFKEGNALAAYHGIMAAEMALNGYEGMDDPLTAKKTVFEMFAPSAYPSDLTKDLGKRYFSDAVIKPWACCRGNHVVLDAARNDLNGTKLRAKDIKHVKFGATNSVTNGEYKWGSTCEVDGLVNRRFTLSTYLLTGEVTTASYDSAWMTNPDLKDVLSKLEFYEWNPLKGAKGSGGFAACIDIELVDGRTLHGEVKGDVLGDVEKKPLPEADFEAKFKRNAEFGGKVPIEKLEEAYQLAAHIDDVEDMGEFMKLLVP